MAKKKEETNENDFDDLEDLDDGEIESVYPKIEKSREKGSSEALDDIDDDLEEEEEFEEPIQDKAPTYKYLDLDIVQKEGKKNYEIYIEGQSHGFLNVFVKHLLELEGVDIAAYKKNNIQSPMIFLKLKEGFKIKEILRKGINNLRDEIGQVQKIFKNLT
ncbi:MAG: hypothetical protein JXA99_07460 [Candidatus Lokiarchaeota archaeon]|nr:hypothetical protein [Candidatus Lokiarchaeota archaeon]